MNRPLADARCGVCGVWHGNANGGFYGEVLEPAGTWLCGVCYSWAMRLIREAGFFA